MVEFKIYITYRLFHEIFWSITLLLVAGNKWPFKEMDRAELQLALRDVLNVENRPLLIHCNRGKHRTGSLIGCLRKIRGWALSSIFSEYILYAAAKSRIEDQLFIESFEYQFSDQNQQLDWTMYVYNLHSNLFFPLSNEAKLAFTPL